MNIPLFLFRKIVLAAITSLFVSSFFIMQAKAQEARLSDIVVTNTNEHLLVYFNVADCFTEEMDKAICKCDANPTSNTLLLLFL